MSRPPAVLLACAVLAAPHLRAASSDYPLAINLPTAERMQFWDIGLGFTHRFSSPVKGHGKDAYGLDGYAYAGLGLAFGIKPVKGLNALVYRTADNKTVTMGLQQQLADADRVRMAVRAERFDETVKHQATPLGEVGILGLAAQLPTEIFLPGDVVLTLVPTWVSRTTTRHKGVFNLGAGLRVELSDKFGLLGEYYPRPSGIDKEFTRGFAAGVVYRTHKHRFTVVGTNTPGTTANQVLSGDYAGGPRPSSSWALGFNVVRVF